MTTMNNEDPADPSVHEPRELPEPAAWRVYFPDEQREELASSLDELCDDLTNCAYDEPEPLYTVDQMREAVAAERERAARVSQATAQRVPARSETGPFAYTGAQLLASQPANDELPEPVARIASLTNHQGGKWYALEPLVSNPLTINTKVYTADQMREAIAAERERSHELLQAADHIRAGLEAKLAALSAALAAKLD